jgi:hypothetical protein
MKTKTLFLFLLLIGFVSVQRASAQQYTYTATAVYVDADIINATSLVDPLSEKIKDVPITSFSLFIANPNQKDIWVNMQLSSHVTLDEDGVKKSMFVSDPQTSNPFRVPPGGRVFRSLDASSKEFDFVFKIDEAEKKILKDKISDAGSGGRVPSGRYEVDITMQVVKIADSTLPSPITIFISPSSHIEVSVTNPTNATLILPSENGFEYPSPFPQFQWTYDTRGVKISVYEKRPEHQSLEDAISASDPFLELEVNRKESGNLSIFTYPQAPVGGPGINFLRGPRPLERGKSYVVVLDGTRTAFGYNIDPLRTIRLFRISDPQGQMILNILQTALSGGAYQNFLNLIQDQKLQINGSRLTLNGVTISAQELQVILNQNKDKIKTIRFED